MPEAHIEMEAEEGCIEAFAACPAGPSPWAPILLLSDSRGLRPAQEGMARRLAGEGYFVLAPDLFYRTGVGSSPTARRAAVDVVLDPDGQAEDFEVWLHALETERQVDDTRIGVVGYGVGAAMALRLAAVHAERIAAAAVFYGGRPSPAEAHHLAACANAVLHLGRAEGDEAAASLEAALRCEGVDFESVVYRAGRGFAVPDHPGYDRAAAEHHWTHLSELFARTLNLSNSGDLGPADRPEDGNEPQDAPRALL